MGDEDKLSAILMQVGETKGKVEAMAGDLTHIKGKMGSVITRGECTGKHKLTEESLSRAVTEVKEELRRGIADIKKTATGQTYQAITPAMLQAAASAPAHDMTPAEMEAALTSRAEERSEKRRKLVTWYIGTGAALVSLLGVLGAATWKVVTTLDKMQTTMAAQPSELRREIQKQGSRVVYVDRVPVPKVDPDPPDPQPKRSPRKLAPKH